MKMRQGTPLTDEVIDQCNTIVEGRGGPPFLSDNAIKQDVLL